MSNPTVTAVINVDDNASPAMKELAALAKRIGQETAAALKGGGADQAARMWTSSNRAAKEHLGVLEKIHKRYEALGTALGAAGLVRSFHAINGMIRQLDETDRETRRQTAVGHLDADAQALMRRQRSDLARRYGYLPMDTIKAENAMIQRGYNPGISVAVVDQSAVLARALGITVEEAVKMLEGRLFAGGTHLSNPAQAAQKTHEAADVAAYMNKRGNMSPEDITQYNKFAAGPAAAFGMTPDRFAAIGMTFKKANVPGDEAGTYLRAFINSVVMPTRKGRDALAAAGINYESFVTRNDASVNAMDAALSRRGHKLNDAGRTYWQNYLDSAEEKTEEGFIAAAVEAARRSGNVKGAADEKAIAAAARAQRELQIKGIDINGLTDAVIHNMTAAQLIGLQGAKQGGRGAILLNNQETYDTSREGATKAEGFAGGLAKERSEGVAAAMERFRGVLDDTSRHLGDLYAGPIAKIANSVTSALTAFDNLPDDLKKGALTAALVGLSTATITVTRNVAGMGASALSAAEALQVLAKRGTAQSVAAAPAAAQPSGTAAEAAEGAPKAGASRIKGAVTSNTAGFFAGILGAEAVSHFTDNPLAQVLAGAIIAQTWKPTTGFLWGALSPVVSNPAAPVIAGGAAASYFSASQFNRMSDDQLHSVADNPFDPDASMAANIMLQTRKTPRSEPAPSATPAAVSVNGEVTGEANVKVTVETVPSPLLETRLLRMENGLMQLRGSMRDGLGTTFSGSNGVRAPLPILGGP